MINRCLLLKLHGSRKAMRRPRSSPASATAAKWVKPRVRTSRGASAMGKEYPGIPIPQITTGRSGSGSALQPRDQKLRKIPLAFSNADAEAGATERLQSWCSQKCPRLSKYGPPVLAIGLGGAAPSARPPPRSSVGSRSECAGGRRQVEHIFHGAHSVARRNSTAASGFSSTIWPSPSPMRHATSSGLLRGA